MGIGEQSQTTDASYNNEEEMTIDGYRLLQRLGHGKFGIAYLAQMKDNGQNVCIKVFHEKPDDPETLKSFQTEIEAGNASFNHQNVLKLVSYGADCIKVNGKDVTE